jgi:transcriptional regulator NrdR family protein
MPASFSTPTCPECFGPTKVKSNLNERRTYDLVRLRECLDCQHRFYTRQTREKPVPLENIKWRRDDRNSRTVLIVAD